MDTKILAKLAKLDNKKVNADLAEFAKVQEKTIHEAKSNDAISNELKLLKQYIYRVPKQAIKIIKSIVNSEKPLKPTKEQIKGYGEIQGKTHSDLAIECVELLERIQYLEMKEVFQLFIKLSNSKNKSISEAAIKSLNDFAGYDLRVLKKIGYGTQLFIIKEINNWTKKQLAQNFEAILELSKQLLSPSFEGRSWKDYKTMSFQTGALDVNKALKDIRTQTKEILKLLYYIADDLTRQKQTLNIIQEITHTPYQGNYKQDMEDMVLIDTNEIIKFYLEIIPTADVSVLQSIEKQINWFLRRFKEKKLKNIKKIQTQLAKNKNFEFFNVLVGHDFEGRGKMGWKEADKLRKERVNAYVASIETKNYDEWIVKIISIAKYHSIDPSALQYFNIFLFELGKQECNLAIKLLKENEKELKPFLIHLLHGIWKNDSAKAKEVIHDWIKKGKNLNVCAILFSGDIGPNLEILEKIFKKAKEKEDSIALSNIIHSVWQQYPEYKKGESLFFDSIQELTKLGNYSWLNSVYYKDGEVLFNKLSDEKLNIILESMLLVPRLDYQLEGVLNAILAEKPKKLVDFFAKRVIKRDKIKKHDLEMAYSDIPFRSTRLAIHLKGTYETKVVSEIFKWFQKKEWPWHWKASHLLASLFPGITKSIKKEMIALIRSKDEKLMNPVLSILHAYQEVIPYDICKEIIKIHGDKYKDDIFIALSQTGVTTGEYGLMEAHKQKKKDIQIWKDEKNKNIIKFLKEYIEYLDKQIAYEKKNADEEIELRKRGF